MFKSTEVRLLSLYRINLFYDNSITSLYLLNSRNEFVNKRDRHTFFIYIDLSADYLLEKASLVCLKIHLLLLHNIDSCPLPSYIVL